MSVVVRRNRRVVIIDDSRTSQAVLEIAFEAAPDFEVVGIAADAEEGLDLVRSLAPDLVTIDLCMPFVDGSALLERMATMTGVCKLVVSEQITKSIALSARLESLGASLCLSKRELAADRAGFFRKIVRVCEQFEAAPPPPLPAPRPAVAAVRAAEPQRAGTLVHFGYPIPADEEARVDLLRRKQLANAIRERQFDLITRYVAEATAFPVCLLTFIDRDTQWIKSSFGYDECSGPRAEAFCNYTIATGDLFVVANAATDPRFRDHPCVVGEPGFRTYAGQAILSDEGVRLGALCVLDRRVRSVPAAVTRHLIGMAQIVGSMIDIRPPLAA